MKQTTGISISRECGCVMRGMAIVIIALHNFCHLVPGVVGENEFTFGSDRADALVAQKETFTAFVFDMLSFFGWYGVTVFMFLTGYGLVMKYEREKTPLSPPRFILHNYLKLLFLMLPAIVVFFFLTLRNNLKCGYVDYGELFNCVMQLTMLPDLFWGLGRLLWPSPGVFWYFGLAMQFYIIYALFIHGKNPLWMWILTAISLALQFAVNPAAGNMVWLRFNATGWMTVLALGIVCGRISKVPKAAVAVVLALSVLLLWPSMLNSVTWQFSILAWVVIAVTVAKVSMMVPLWRTLWIWMGRLSPYIFVAHPVARYLVFPMQKHREPMLESLAVYLGLTIVIALVFRLVTGLFYRRFLPGERFGPPVATDIEQAGR